MKIERKYFILDIRPQSYFFCGLKSGARWIFDAWEYAPDRKIGFMLWLMPIEISVQFRPNLSFSRNQPGIV